jgi:hypothetical protein
MRFYRILLTLLPFGAVVLAAEVPKPESRTVWSGVYTSKQAARGAASYSADCGRCHREDLSGYTGLRGAKFVDNWREDSLQSLWVRISKTMPMGAPGTLKQSEYLDILAFILQSNDFPAGSQELSADAIPNIRVEGKSGPAPVPDFALVQTVGCLAKDADEIWRVKQASEPVRTRNPNSSSAVELQAAAAQALGGRTVRLLDGSSLKEDSQPGRKVEVKGYLIRKPDEDRINPTSVEIVSQVCR